MLFMGDAWLLRELVYEVHMFFQCAIPSSECSEHCWNRSKIGGASSIALQDRQIVHCLSTWTLSIPKLQFV